MMELTRLSIKTNCSPLKHSPNFNRFIHHLMNNYRVQGSEAQLPSPKLKKSQTSGRGDSHSPLRDLFSSSTGEGGRPPLPSALQGRAQEEGTRQNKKGVKSLCHVESKAAAGSSCSTRKQQKANGPSPLKPH